MFDADASPIFPACPTYGFTVDPLILVKIVTLESGFERTTRKWRQALRTYSGMPVGQKPQADIEAVMYFYLALGAMSTAFRFKDWTDYKSCVLDDEPTPIDQPVQVTTDQSPERYRLVKNYSAGGFTHTRTISRPRGETIRVANEHGVEQTDWNLDEATGYIVPGGTFAGIPTAWGGEFDVYCRFDGNFQIEISNFKIQTATVNLIEKREA